jgi:transposase-like protein
MQVDPDAIVGFFPCDHHYSDDESFRFIVRSATAGAVQFPGSLVIVGAEAECAETEYGWIEPGPALGEPASRLCRVNRFWEKPALPQARALLQSGCLWNTFVTIGSAATFLELVCAEVPDVVLSLTRAMADNDMVSTYARLPNVDFSRDILARQANKLLVVRDSGSGWADLGSPHRVLGLLAKSANQPAWFRQTNGSTLQVGALREVVLKAAAAFAGDNPHQVGKTVVMGMLDRDARQVRAKVIPNIKRTTLQEQILNHIEGGTTVHTDEFSAYSWALADKFTHEVINHLKGYVDGKVHTQGIENFWSLLKRSLRGSYVAVEPFHLDRYVDEQVFRYNNRATKDNPLNDSDRFDLAVRQIVGKRLTYADLTGKESAIPF